MTSRNSKKQSLAVVLGMATVVAGTEPTLAAAFLIPSSSTSAGVKKTTALKMSSWADSNVDTNKKAQARETGAPLTPFRSSSRANGAVVYDPDTYYQEEEDAGYDSHLNIAARKNDASQMAAIPTLRPNTEPAIKRKGDAVIVDDPAASIPKLMPNTEPAFARSKTEAAAPVQEEEASVDATKEKETKKEVATEITSVSEEGKQDADLEEEADAVEAVVDKEQEVTSAVEETAAEESSIEEKEEEVVAEAALEDSEEVKEKKIVAEEEATPTEPVYYEPKAPSKKQTASTTRPFFPAVRIESDVERTGITLETNRIKSAFRPRDIPGATVYDPQTGLVEAAQTEEEDPYEAAAKKGVVVGGDNRSNSPAGTFAVDSYSDPKRSFFPGVRIESDVSRVGKTKEVNRIKSPFEPNRPKTAQLYDPAASGAGASWKDQMKASAFGYDSGSSAAQERRPFFPAVTIESDVNQVGETKEVNRIRSPFRGRLVPGAKVYNSGEEQQQP